jgi:hypothetical protein
MSLNGECLGRVMRHTVVVPAMNSMGVPFHHSQPPHTRLTQQCRATDIQQLAV